MGAFKIYNTTTEEWEYARTLSANSTLVNGADLAGTVNGVNTTFITPTPFVFVNVYKNGVRMRAGATNDYTVSGDSTIIFNTAPATGSILTVDYGTLPEQMINGSNSIVSDETPAGTVNGTTTLFTAAKGYIPGTLQVWINGLKQKRGTHFTETDATAGTFTMSEAPAISDDIMIAYQFVVSATANADTVDGYHASSTPVASAIPVLDSNARLPISTFERPMARLTHGARPTVSITTAYQPKVIDASIAISSGASGYLTPDITTDRITVGAGVSKVKISAQFTLFTSPGAGQVNLQILKNGVSVVDVIGSQSAAGILVPLSSQPKTISVAPGDYLQLAFTAALTGSFTIIMDNDLVGWFQVEAVG